jgi:hypothetical protein
LNYQPLLSTMEKQYQIDFRDDYNGRPKIMVMCDNTRFLVTHPFYFDDGKNYGRCYTYYLVDDNYDLSDEIEIWMYDSGTFCMESHWNDFKGAFLNIDKEIGIKTELIVNKTKFSVKRISSEEFTPNKLKGNVSILDFFKPKIEQKLNDNNYVCGYVKFSNDVFSISEVDWNIDDDINDEQKYKYCAYNGELNLDYRNGDFYNYDLVVHKDSNVKDTGTVYSDCEKGIFLFLNK